MLVETEIQTGTKFEGLKVSVQWIEKIEGTSSRLLKEEVIEQALMMTNLGCENAECFLFNCYLAYNPFFVFNIRQVEKTVGLTGQPNPWPLFWALCEDLRTRSITGNAAKQAIRDVSRKFDSVEWNNVCRRVLIKDLRCGISEKTLNKILGDTQWAIPVFSCQLATDCSGQPSKMKGLKRLESKFDGVRALIMVTATTVNIMSRNGKPFENFPQISQEVQDHYHQLAEVFGSSFVLDGEIMGESFQQLMKQARRKTDVETVGMVFNVFDVLSSDDFRDGISEVPQSERILLLNKIKPIVDQFKYMTVVDGIEVDLDTEEGHKTLWKYAAEAVDAGLEGIMIKDMSAPYRCKRSTAWMKYKPVLSVDLTIVGVEEGTGRNAGRMGAIICEGEDDGRNIRVNVGSGFSDDDRNQYWVERDQLLGQLVEVEADVVTQNQDGTYSLRFPRFVRFRSFEVGQKI